MRRADEPICSTYSAPARLPRIQKPSVREDVKHPNNDSIGPEHETENGIEVEHEMEVETEFQWEFERATANDPHDAANDPHHAGSASCCDAAARSCRQNRDETYNREYT